MSFVLIMSHVLFSLYINDCNLEFLSNGNAPIELQELSFFFVADGMVILSQSDSDLQSVLNTFENYTKKWSITVNVNKTNKMVFRNGGILLTED